MKLPEKAAGRLIKTPVVEAVPPQSTPPKADVGPSAKQVGVSLFTLEYWMKQLVGVPAVTVTVPR